MLSNLACKCKRGWNWAHSDTNLSVSVMPREQVDIKNYDLHHKSSEFFNISTSVASTSFPGSFTSPQNRSKRHWEQAYYCITKQPPTQGSSYEQRVSFVLGPKVLGTRLVTNLFLDRTKDLCFCERFHGPSLVCHIDNFAAVLLKAHFVHKWY